MAKAVWKINKDGRQSYVGHVPDNYKLQKGEYFGIPPEYSDWVEVIRNA